MSENWNEFEHYDDRTSPEIVRDRVEMLGAVFNRKVTEGLIAVFQDCLGKFPAEAIKRAFRKAESSLERFPTPKAMLELVTENLAAADREDVPGKYCKNCFPDGWWKRERADMPGYFFVTRCPCQGKTVRA